MSQSPLRRLLFPFILVIATVLLRKHILLLEPDYQKLLAGLPYVMLGLAMALCVYFNRARTFTAALVFLVIYYLTLKELQMSLTEVRTLFIYTALSVSVPVTFLLLMLLPERGLRNRYGMLMIAIVPLQVLLAMVLYRSYPEATLFTAINTWLPIHPFPQSILSIPASVSFALIVLAALFMLLKHDSEYHAALVVLLVTGFMTLARFDLPRISVLMCSVAGMSLIISLLRSSYEMAYRDELTGIPGRRALNERLKGLGRHYVIAMLDVDHFKKFNDTYGHDAGDDVLKMVAKQIAAVQGGGIAYRYGGEEFSIVFPGRGIEECKPYLEDVRRSVEGYRVLLRNQKQRPQSWKLAQERRGRRNRTRDGKNVSVTISIGVAAPKNRQSRVDEVFKSADAALYKAKQNGRNCMATSR